MPGRRQEGDRAHQDSAQAARGQGGVPTSCRGLYRYCCSVWWVTMSSESRMLRRLCSRDCMSRHTALALSRLYGSRR